MAPPPRPALSGPTVAGGRGADRIGGCPETNKRYNSFPGRSRDADAGLPSAPLSRQIGWGPGPYSNVPCVVSLVNSVRVCLRTCFTIIVPCPVLRLIAL